jgi:tRNA threonylcarbamoyl adenosine modification protein YeaZ
MKILAIDTSLPAVSACVLDRDSATSIASETIPMERGHGEALAPLIQRVVAQTDGGFDAIDRVAVTIGPGSFTGIRIGLAAAQAIALACGADVVGVSTLSAIAAPLMGTENDAVVCASIDARHGNIFVAAFATDGRPLLTPRRVGVVEALRALGAGPVVFVGSGAELLAREARTRGVGFRIENTQPYPDIEFVARLGLVADPARAPARPMYLKEPEVTVPRMQSAVRSASASLPARGP